VVEIKYCNRAIEPTESPDLRRDPTKIEAKATLNGGGLAKGSREGFVVRWQGARMVEHGGGGSGRARAPREAWSTGWTEAGTDQVVSPA
jgi:hypothetical protein